MKFADQKPFSVTKLEEDRQKKPLPVKLNDKEEEMLEIGMYAFNMHTKSSVLKILAEMGLKVLLDTLGVENMHKITNPRRTKLIPEEPKYNYFNKR